MTSHTGLIVGVDGGGSKTTAILARRDNQNQAQELGRGRSGPSNCRSVGIETATKNVRSAVDAAFEAANITPTTVEATCLSLAGADRAVEKSEFEQWATDQNLTARLTVTNDALPVLYAASPNGIGIALISGTGSVAVGRNAEGESLRCGGWGSLLGDEGSGYRIAIEALRAVSRAIDHRTPETKLTNKVFEFFDIERSDDLIPIIYDTQTTRGKIAALAPRVFDVAGEGDSAATSIIQTAVDDLRQIVTTLAKRLGLVDTPFPLAISGGILLHHEGFVDQLVRGLRRDGLEPRTVPIKDAATGAVNIALNSITQ